VMRRGQGLAPATQTPSNAGQGLPCEARCCYDCCHCWCCY
jgi:hypothetical protein